MVTIFIGLKNSDEQFSVQEEGLTELEAKTLYGPYGNGEYPPIRLKDGSLLCLSRDLVGYTRVIELKEKKEKEIHVVED